MNVTLSKSDLLAIYYCAYYGKPGFADGMPVRFNMGKVHVGDTFTIDVNKLDFDHVENYDASDDDDIESLSVDALWAIFEHAVV